MQQNTINVLGFLFLFHGLSLLPTRVEAKSCAPAFLIESHAAVGTRELAKKSARKKVYQQAKERCVNKALVYVQRWQYLCEKKEKRFSCKARMKFRCCEESKGKQATQKDTHRVLVKKTKKSRTSSPSRRTEAGYRMAVARSSSTVVKKQTRSKVKKQTRVKISKKQSKKRRAKTRRVASLKKYGAAMCRVTRLVVVGHHRGKSKTYAEVEARGQARIKANELCGNLIPVWVSSWQYRCAASGKQFICEAKSTIKCCHKKP